LALKRLHLTTESTRDYAIINLDMAEHIVSWNEEAEYIFGYRAVKAYSQPHTILFTLKDWV
jgi:PAS domain S-box-containing protein